jgi:hypothetical protein
MAEQQEQRLRAVRVALGASMGNTSPSSGWYSCGVVTERTLEREAYVASLAKEVGALRGNYERVETQLATGTLSFSLSLCVSSLTMRCSGGGKVSGAVAGRQPRGALC